jgi:hypothetical protein
MSKRMIGPTGRLQPAQRVNSAMRMMIGIGTPSSQSRIERMVPPRIALASGAPNAWTSFRPDRGARE